MTDTLSATHIRLICWGDKHVQAVSPEALRRIRTAPICTASVDGGICGQPIWAVEHDDEPTRYVGRPPHQHYADWAECIPPAPEPRPEAQ